MNTSTVPAKVSRKQLIIDAGRAHLRTWLLAAEAHGTIYYNVQSVSRSGMNRKIALSTIIIGRDGRPELVRLWPSFKEETVPRGMHPEWSQALDVIARDWGFSFDARAFNVSGCGMDMVFALVDGLAHRAGLNKHDGSAQGNYANRVRREAF